MTAGTGTLPLGARRIVVTRAEGAARNLAARLRALGAEPIGCPTITIAPPTNWEPLDIALSRLADYDWLVFTSVNAVRAFVGRLAGPDPARALPSGLRIAAIGQVTAAATRSLLRAPDLVPEEARAAALVAALGVVVGQRFLLPSSDIARPELTVGLRAAGATVEVVTTYRTVPVAPESLGRVVELLRAGALDAITLTSPSTAAGLFEGLADRGLATEELVALPRRPLICCIGPTTADAVRERGLSVDAVADQQTDEGLIAALMSCLAGRRATVSEGERIDADEY